MLYRMRLAGVVVLAMVAAIMLSAVSQVHADGGNSVSTSDGAPATLTTLAPRSVSGGSLVADLNMVSSSTVTFNTMSSLNASCATLAAYRLTEWGDLTLQPVTCDGSDNLTLVGLGGGFPVDYFFVKYASADDAAAAATDILHGNF